MGRQVIPLLAAAACLPTPDVYAALSRDYHESRAIAGLNGRGNVAEIWTSPAGTWTLILTRPDGLSCIVDSGAAVEVYDPVPPGDPA